MKTKWQYLTENSQYNFFLKLFSFNGHFLLFSKDLWIGVKDVVLVLLSARAQLTVKMSFLISSFCREDKERPRAGGALSSIVHSDSIIIELCICVSTTHTD
ncbi:hypothetical protein NL108_006807 [Boleophthalmus pectinirostris]|nr:hypothetical protein NL108_006807 [Boleophthalmus pectinirostris]